MELLTLLAMFVTSALLSLVGGLFIGRGDKVEKLNEVEDLNNSNSAVIEGLRQELEALKTQVNEGGGAPVSEKKADNKFEGDDTEVIDRSTADQLEAEVEILRTELVLKEKELKKLEENNNRLGGRILEVENELQQKEAQLMKKIIATESATKSELIKEGMDSFLEALQKESDVLRGELENAYRMINRQEKELSRYRGEADEPTISENDLHNRIEQLTEQNDQLVAAITRYEEALKSSPDGHEADVDRAVGMRSKVPPPPPGKSQPRSPAAKKAPTPAPAAPSIYAKKSRENTRKKKSISSFQTVRSPIVPESNKDLPSKDKVPGSLGAVPSKSVPRKRVGNSQKLKTIVPKGGVPSKKN